MTIKRRKGEGTEKGGTRHDDSVEAGVDRSAPVRRRADAMSKGVEGIAGRPAGDSGGSTKSLVGVIVKRKPFPVDKVREYLCQLLLQTYPEGQQSKEKVIEDANKHVGQALASGESDDGAKEERQAELDCFVYALAADIRKRRRGGGKARVEDEGCEEEWSDPEGLRAM